MYTMKTRKCPTEVKPGILRNMTLLIILFHKSVSKFPNKNLRRFSYRVKEVGALVIAPFLEEYFEAKYLLQWKIMKSIINPAKAPPKYPAVFSFVSCLSRLALSFFAARAAILVVDIVVNSSSQKIKTMVERGDEKFNLIR